MKRKPLVEWAKESWLTEPQPVPESFQKGNDRTQIKTIPEIVFKPARSRTHPNIRTRDKRWKFAHESTVNHGCIWVVLKAHFSPARQHRDLLDGDEHYQSMKISILRYKEHGARTRKEVTP